MAGHRPRAARRRRLPGQHTAERDVDRRLTGEQWRLGAQPPIHRMCTDRAATAGAAGRGRSVCDPAARDPARPHARRPAERHQARGSHGDRGTRRRAPARDGVARRRRGLHVHPCEGLRRQGHVHLPGTSGIDQLEHCHGHDRRLGRQGTARDLRRACLPGVHRRDGKPRAERHPGEPGDLGPDFGTRPASRSTRTSRRRPSRTAGRCLRGSSLSAEGSSRGPSRARGGRCRS